MSYTQPTVVRSAKALPTLCDGCLQPFEPTRKDQKHCKPSCRWRAHERRKAPKREDLFWEPDTGRLDRDSRC